MDKTPRLLNEETSYNPNLKIPVRITSRFSKTNYDQNTPTRIYNPNKIRNTHANLIAIKPTRNGPPTQKIIPKCMVINARSLAKPQAVSALDVELSTWEIDICFVCETWLNSKILSNLVCPNNYLIVRKDRGDGRNGGGVAIICREDWKCKSLNFQNNLECIWCEIETANSKYYVASVYHPPDPTYQESELLNHLSESIEQILQWESNARIIIGGDVNQLKVKDIISQHNMEQMVRKPTRGQKVLDIFLTNCPHLWNHPRVFDSLVKSDHLAVVITPRVAVKPERKTVYFRDARDHRKFAMVRELEAQDWSCIDDCEDVNESVMLLNHIITSAFNNSFPLIKIILSTRDPPHMSPLVKHLCKIRNKSVRKGVNEDLQRKINKLIRENMVSEVKKENGKYASGSKKWWDTVNKITGRKANHTSINIDPSVINSYFQTINTDDNYTYPELVPIPNETRVPNVDIPTVERFLERQKKTSTGPDGLPYWVWKDFAKYLAPVITKIFNMSLEQQCVPLL